MTDWIIVGVCIGLGLAIGRALGWLFAHLWPFILVIAVFYWLRYYP